MAPSYAKIFMDRLENSLPDGYHKKPHTWLRYIDEICMIWTEGEEQLKVFLSYLNSIFRRQCGPVVRALSLRSGDPGFKTRSNHSLNLILVVPGSTSQLHL